MPREPRWKNTRERKKLQMRLMAEGRPCWICQLAGRSGVIDYSLKYPHPYSFVMDELVPVSKYEMGGYPSAMACALDYGNLAAAHKCCNEWRSNKTVEETKQAIIDLKYGKSKRRCPDIQVRPSRDWRHPRKEVDDAQEQGATDQ
jgi:hypothetical protein